MATKSTGVYQKDNGYWEYRFVMMVDTFYIYYIIKSPSRSMDHELCRIRDPHQYHLQESLAQMVQQVHFVQKLFLLSLFLVVLAF